MRLPVVLKLTQDKATTWCASVRGAETNAEQRCWLHASVHGAEFNIGQ